jgi:hypothetical protein
VGADGPIDVTRAEIGTLTAAIGSGVGASYAIEAGGGLAAMGAGAIPAATAGASGFAASAAAGALIGNYAYYHSETVQQVSQAAVGFVIETYNDVMEHFEFDVNREYRDTIGEYSCTAAGPGVAMNLLDDLTDMYV